MKISMQMDESWPVRLAQTLANESHQTKNSPLGGFQIQMAERRGEFSGGLLFSRKDKTI